MGIQREAIASHRVHITLKQHILGIGIIGPGGVGIGFVTGGQRRTIERAIDHIVGFKQGQTELGLEVGQHLIVAGKTQPSGLDNIGLEIDIIGTPGIQILVIVDGTK